MYRLNNFLLFAVLFFSCSTHKNMVAGDETSIISENSLHVLDTIPSCLTDKIRSLSTDPSEGSPISITRYNYRGQTVFYLKSACCDKFNIVFNSTCEIIGFPDGGFTGRGDGKMTGFKEEVTDAKIVWQQDIEKEKL